MLSLAVVSTNANFNRAHFLDYTPSKGALDSDYLEALFLNDTEEIVRIENAASGQGYGPLASCDTVANFSSQRLVCHKYSVTAYNQTDGK